MTPEPLEGAPAIMDLGDSESRLGMPIAPFPGALYGPSHAKGPTRSRAVVAVKRAVSRWNPSLLPWAKFSPVYTLRLEKALRALQREHHIQVSGQYGRATHETLRRERRYGHPGEYAFDALACSILYDLAHPPVPPEEKARDAIADYCRASVMNEPRIHYRQLRPMHILGVDPRGGFTADCSEHATAAYYWARKVTKLPVADPNHRYFDGYGFTGTLLENPRVTSGAYKVGDLAIYGHSQSNTTHVATCYMAGDASSAVWCSLGSEIGPLPVRLHYRGDLIRVVRPVLFLT